jgi:hypothetical protein
MPAKIRKGRIIRPIVATPYTKVTYSQLLGCSFFCFLGFSKPIIIS